MGPGDHARATSTSPWTSLNSPVLDRMELEAASAPRQSTWHRWRITSSSCSATRSGLRVSPRSPTGIGGVALVGLADGYWGGQHPKGACLLRPARQDHQVRACMPAIRPAHGVNGMTAPMLVRPEWGSVLSDLLGMNAGIATRANFPTGKKPPRHSQIRGSWRLDGSPTPP